MLLEADLILATVDNTTLTFDTKFTHQIEENATP